MVRKKGEGGKKEGREEGRERNGKKEGRGMVRNKGEGGKKEGRDMLGLQKQTFIVKEIREKRKKVHAYTLS